MADDKIDADRVVITETTTVDVAPATVDEQWLAENFDGDHVKANDRATGDWLGTAGEDVAFLVCPACGEECRSGRNVGGTMYFRHHETEDCERDVADQLDSTGRTETATTRRSLKFQVAQLAIGFAISAAAGVGIYSEVRSHLAERGGTVEFGSPLPAVETLVIGFVLLFIVAVVVQIAPQLRGEL